MIRRRLDLPERHCELAACPARFKPVRRRQKFHNRICRQRAWRLRRFASAPAPSYAPAGLAALQRELSGL